ncbi:hypothetical protein, partial [Pseudomonas syringae group genomosp. 3]|uniref:hypothetical protein n=1 Tax=Pseudomonas syringae group genomosp. 3 TaxID=251701 RepID=UPI001F40B543
MPYPKRPASPPEMDAERARKAALHEMEFTKNHPKQALGDYIFFGKHGEHRFADTVWIPTIQVAAHVHNLSRMDMGFDLS